MVSSAGAGATEDQGDTSMRVETVLTVEDFRAFCAGIWQTARRLPPPHEPNPRRRRALEVLGFIGLVGFDFAVLRMIEGPPVTYFAVAAVLALPWYLVFVYLNTKARRRLEPVASGDIIGPHSYELTDEGISVVTRNTESVFRWTGVQSIEETADHLFLYTDRCAAVIVPKRSFESPEHAEAFKAFAQARVVGK